MIRDFFKKLPLVRLHWGWGLLLTAPLAFLATVLVIYIQPGSLTEQLLRLLGQPLLAFLNFLPLWLLTLCFGFLCSNPFFGAAWAGALGGILSLVSRTMIEKRDEPLTPKDFDLIKEAGNAMQNYSIELHVPSVLAIVFFVLLMAAAGLLVRNTRPFEKRWQKLCVMFGGAAVSFGVLWACVVGVYSSKPLYNSFPVTNRSYITSVYGELGFPYCFCYNFTAYQVEKPDGYSSGKAQEYMARYPATVTDPKNVNVVMVMNEAFSDITDFEAFDFPEGDDPLQFYHSLQSSPNAIVGHVVVPNYGAGTANAEFDVITGMQTQMIREGGISAFRVLNHGIDSLFRVFGEDGYQTQFIHPGEDWFYNRQNVYRYFGVDQMLFSEAFPGVERRGGWVTDHAVLEKLKAEFEAAMKKGQPYFNYTVTIQNHMSYTEKKYGDEHVFEPVPLKKEVSPEAHSMLSVYTEGVRDADAMLRGLTEYYGSREEPVVLVFFGDHLPNLGDSFYSYSELGMSVGTTGSIGAVLSTYETPYVIWVNDAASQLLEFSSAKESLDLPDDNTINANYLGAVLLELTGRRDQNSFFSFLNELRRKLPILRQNVGRTGDGAYFDQLPEEYAEEIKILRYWEYYRLKEERR